eukprot:scaffold8923_cov67-Phaeocystis_antarctica.AAC.12
MPKQRMVQNGRSPSPATAHHGTQSARNPGARKAGSKAHVSSLVLKGIAADQPCHTVRGNEEATARLQMCRGHAWALHEVNRENAGQICTALDIETSSLRNTGGGQTGAEARGTDRDSSLGPETQYC